MTVSPLFQMDTNEGRRFIAKQCCLPCLVSVLLRAREISGNSLTKGKRACVLEAFKWQPELLSIIIIKRPTPNRLREFDATLARQAHIHQHDIEDTSLHDLDSLIAIMRDVRLIAENFE